MFIQYKTDSVHVCNLVGKNIIKYIQYFLCFPYAHFLTVFVLIVFLSSYVYLFISFLFVVPYVLASIGIRKVLRPATSIQVFVGFPVSISEC